MATDDDKLAEMKRALQESNKMWKELKTALLARGDKPIFVSKEMRDRIEAAQRAEPEKFARIRNSLSN